MAGYVGPSISELPGWRVGILFLFFALVALLWHKGVRALDRHFKARGKRGLRHVVRALEDELLILGLISLLLVAFEKYLLLVCVPCDPSSDCYWDCNSTESDPAECDLVDTTCGPGSEPFWSPNAIIQAHILLFVIAAVHILYTTVSTLVCLWKVGRWKAYEELSHGEMLAIEYSTVPIPGGNPVLHFLRCMRSMFTESVNASVYTALRRHFVHRMGVDDDFDFHAFVVESMEEQMAQIVGVDWMLWGLVILWIMLPPQSYVMVWMAGLAALAILIVGVKLESIINQLTVDAFGRYGVRRSPPASPSALQSLRDSLRRLSPFPLMARTSANAAAAEGGDLAGGAGGKQHGAAQRAQQGRPPADVEAPDSPPGGAAAGSCASMVLRQPGHSSTQLAAVPMPLEAKEAGHGQQGSSGGVALVAAREVLEAEEAVVEILPGESTAGIAGSAVVGATVQQGTHHGSEAGVSSGMVRIEDTAASEVAVALQHMPGSNGCAEAGGAGEGGGCNGLADGLGIEQQLSNGHAGPEHPALASKRGERWEQHLGEEEEEGEGQGEEQAAAEGNPPASSVFRRCLVHLLPCIHVQQLAAGAAGCLARCWPGAGGGSESAGGLEPPPGSFCQHGSPGLDAASLFWLGRPRFMLRIIQLVYFENSMALATFLFSLWQGVDFDWGRGQRSQWATIVPLLVVDVCLLFFSALLVLPVYAMTNAAGSHCPATILQNALKKRGAAGQIARALHRMSMEMKEGQVPPSGHQEASLELTAVAQPAGGALFMAQPQLPPGPGPGPGPEPAGWGVVPTGTGGVGGGGAPPLARPSLGRASAGTGVSSAHPGMHPGPPSLARSSMGVPGLWQEAGGAATGALMPPGLGQEELLGQLGGGEEEEEEGQKSLTRLLGAMYRRQTRRMLERASASGALTSEEAQQAQQAGGHGWFPESECHSLPAGLAGLRALQQEPSLSVPAALHTSLRRRQQQQQQQQQRPSLNHVMGLFASSEGPGPGIPAAEAGHTAAAGAPPQQEGAGQGGGPGEQRLLPSPALESASSSASLELAPREPTFTIQAAQHAAEQLASQRAQQAQQHRSEPPPLQLPLPLPPEQQQLQQEEEEEEGREGSGAQQEARASPLPQPPSSTSGLHFRFSYKGSRT